MAIYANNKNIKFRLFAANQYLIIYLEDGDVDDVVDSLDDCGDDDGDDFDSVPALFAFYTQQPTTLS